jgi:hypothetical protein
MRRLSLLTIDSLSLIAYSCSSPAPKQETAASTEAEASVEPETTTVEGWWDLGDFVGPFTATLNGDDILCIERNLHIASRFEARSLQIRVRPPGSLP